MPGEKQQELHGTIRYCPDCGGQRSENETSCASCGSTKLPIDSKQTTPFAPAQEKQPYQDSNQYNVQLASLYFDSKTGQFFKKADDKKDDTSQVDDIYRRIREIEDHEPAHRVRPYKSKEFNPATGVDTDWHERDFGGDMKSNLIPGNKQKNVDYKDIQRVMDCLFIDG